MSPKWTSYKAGCWRMNLPEENEKLGYETKAMKQQNDTSKEEKLRKPTIIYVDTPKIIHADEKRFMSLVQELTGKNSSSGSQPSSSSSRGTSSFAKEISEEKRDDAYSAFSHGSLVKYDDQVVADRTNEEDGILQSLEVDEVDVYLSPPY